MRKPILPAEVPESERELVLLAGRAKPLVIACDIFLRSIAITNAWRTRKSSNGATLVLKA